MKEQTVRRITKKKENKNGCIEQFNMPLISIDKVEGRQEQWYENTLRKITVSLQNKMIKKII